MKLKINYTKNESNYEKILSHLKLCNSNFTPKLSERLNLEVYSKKIEENSVKFEAWNEMNQLIGLVACYFNNDQVDFGFITNVSVIKNYQGNGIANVLIQNCISYTKVGNKLSLQLEVIETNVSAIRLYEKNGFVKKIKNDQIIKMEYKL